VDNDSQMKFAEAVQGLMAGDFSRLAPLFESSPNGSPPQIVIWHESGLFDSCREALAEAFSCACFNGCLPAVEYFLNHGVDPNGGDATGMNALHWAANRGQLEVVDLLVRRGAALERKNIYGGTLLDATVWSAIHETKAKHLEIIKVLLKAGADVAAVEYPTGDDQIDRILEPYHAKRKSGAELTSDV
jgi:Ankyrin repeats (3 copies)